uniref:Uncharacterized protein n=1 Tax=Sphaerodactylus townsendi TaxID=933632 RepID=A0ACB8E8E9_9SAUR
MVEEGWLTAFVVLVGAAERAWAIPTTEQKIHENNYQGDEQEEEDVNSEDDTYMIMVSSESHHNGCFSLSRTTEQPGVCRQVQDEAGVEAEVEQEEEEGVVKECANEEANKTAEESCQDDDSLYATIDGEDSETDTKDLTCEQGPPLPPRVQQTTSTEAKAFYVFPGTES